MSPTQAFLSRLTTLPFGVRVGSALGLALIGYLVRLPLAHSFQDHHAFVTFYPAVAIAALLLGFWAGFICTLASALIVYLAIPGAPSWRIVHDLADMVPAVFFVCAGVVVSITGAHAARGRRSEAALLESEQRYRAIVEAQADMVCRFLMDGTVLFVNEPYARPHGRKAMDLIGKNFWDWIAPSDREQVRRTLESLNPERPVVQVDNRIETPGGPRWTRWTNHALRFDKSGRAVELQSTGTDITERKRAEEEREQLAAQKQLALNAAKLGWWHYDPQNHSGTRDARFCEIFGSPLDSGDNDSTLRLIHPEDRDQVWAAVERALDPRDPQPYAAEYRIIRPDGQIRWIEAHGLATFEGEGGSRRAIGLAGTVADITERKAAELSLREREERLTAVFDQTEIGIAQANLQGGFDLVNDRYCQMLGRTREELTAETVRSVTHPDDWARNAALLQECAAAGRSFVIEKRYVRPDGSHLWVSNSVSLIRGSSGEPRAVQAMSVDITQRRLAADALRRSEQKLRLALEAAEMGTWVYTFDDHIVRLDPAAQRLYRQPSADWLHDEAGMHGLLHEDDIPAMWAAVARACDPAGEGRYRTDYRIIQDDGSVRWLSAWGITEFAGEGDSRRPVRIVGATRDVTAAFEGEELLRRSAETFKDLIRNSPFGVYVVDSDFLLVEVSAGAQRVFGSVRPLIGRDFAEVIRILWEEPFATEAIERFRHTLQTGEPYHAPDTVKQRADIAEVEAYDWKIERITLPDGRFGVVCNFYDLSERQRHEEALRKSEARFRSLANSMPQLVWTADPDGRVDYYNERIADFHGFIYLEETGGWEWRDGIHPDDVPATAKTWARAMTTGQEYIIEHRARMAGTGTEEGEYRWFLSRARPVRDEQGRIVKWFGTATDIQVIKETEEALARANRELNRFVAIASHDLKEPLRGISHLCSFVLEDDAAVSEESRTRLRRVGVLCNRLTEMINGLLDYARAGAQGAAHRLQVCDLGELARRAVDGLGEMASAEDVQISISPALPTLQGDPVMLERIFANLIGNALKYNSSPVKRVEVGVADGEVFVRDNGMGIAPEHQSRVFNLFVRLTSVPSREGAGLGLALVKTIVESHGGRIRLSSTPGEGSTFFMQFPSARFRDARLTPTLWAVRDELGVGS